MNTLKTVLRRDEDLAPDSQAVLDAIRIEIARRPIRRRKRVAAAAGAAGVVVACGAFTAGVVSGSRSHLGGAAGPAPSATSRSVALTTPFPAGLEPAPATPANSPFSPRFVPSGWRYLSAQPSFTSFAGPGDPRTDREAFTGRLVFSLDADYPAGEFSLRAHGRPARFVFGQSGRIQAVQVEVTQTDAPVLSLQLPAAGLPISREALLEMAGTVTIRPFVQVSHG